MRIMHHYHQADYRARYDRAKRELHEVAGSSTSDDDTTILRCPEQHQLERSRAPVGGRICDECNADIGDTAMRYVCKSCDYDMCTECARHMCNDCISS